MQQENNIIENRNALIADGLEEIALMFSMLEKGNLKQALATIESGLTRIEEIAQETDASVLRALTHWMSLNIELDDENKEQISDLLKEDCYSNWIDVLASLLREHNTELLPVLHQSLALPDWPVKSSAPLLKSVANWIEETRIENIQNPHRTLDVSSPYMTEEGHENSNQNETDIGTNTSIIDDEPTQKHIFEEIDPSILNKEYHDESREKVLKEIQEHPDFKESLIQNEKSSVSLDDLEDTLGIESADDRSQKNELTYYKGSCEELNIDSEKDKTSATADNKEITSSDIATEIEKVIMSLTSISTSHEDVFSHTDKYLKELIRLSVLGDALSISSISNLSDWCQRNFILFTQNQTETNKHFASNGECWYWLEYLTTCIMDPDDSAHLALLSSELTREEWQEPLESDELQAILLSLKAVTELLADTSISQIHDLDLSGKHTLQQVEPEIPYLDIPDLVDLETLDDSPIQTSGLQMSWNNDTHPELLAVYLEETPTQINALTPLMVKISQGLANRDEKHTAARMAHTIKGGSAILGITVLSEYAYKLETLLDFSVEHALAKEVLDLLPEAASCLEKLFDAVQSHQSEPDEYFPMLTQLSTIVDNLEDLDSDKEPEELSKPALPDFILNQNSQTAENKPEIAADIEAAEKDDTSLLIDEINIDDANFDEEIQKFSSPAMIKPKELEFANDINLEIDDIVMTLMSISSTSNDILSNLAEYSVELQRFEILTDIAGYPELANLSQWCQSNLSHLAANPSENSATFIASGEAWSWLELVGVSLNDPEEISHLSALTTELMREEWPQPLAEEELQNLLLSLRKNESDNVTHNPASTNKTSFDSQSSSETGINTSYSLSDETIEEDEALAEILEDVDSDEYHETELSNNETELNHDHAPKPVISWDNDIHPELLAIYFQETPDQITELAELLHMISNGKAGSDDHKKAARIAHTIKGASGVVGLSSLVDLTHKLEDILDFSVNNELPTEASELLAEASDCLEGLFETIQNKTVEPEELPSILSMLGEYADSLDAASTITEDDFDFDTDSTDLTDFIEIEKSTTESVSSGAIDTAYTTSPDSESDSFSNNTPVTESHIRVPIQVIDKLLNLAGELVTSSSKVSDHLKKSLQTSKQIKAQDTRVHKMLEELSNTIYQQEQDQSSMLSSLQNSDFDALEMDTYNELHSVAGLLTESILDSEEIENNLNKQLNELNDDIQSLEKLNKELSEVILRSRMVSLNTLVPRLERIVRQTCRKTGKQAELIVSGNNINIDTDILNGLVDPLLHLLRNAIDHGIETSDIRAAKSKTETGQIKLHFRREGNNILMQLKDDGAGIDPEIIYQKAVEKGLIKPDHKFSSNDALNLILQPGFSTLENISDISGRGVGMDVVNNAVQNLKGTLQITSEPEQGTTFDIKIPLTLVTNTTLLVKAGGNPVAIPTDSIDQLLYLSANDVIEKEGKHFVKHEDQELPILSLAELLNWPADDIDFSQSHTLLLIKDTEQMHAINIDEIIYSREVVVKNLNPWINASKGVIGACHLNDGGVAPVLNVHQVIKHSADKHTSNNKIKVNTVLKAEKDRVKQILIVDDSLSNRKALSLIIDQTEYDVITAVDGLDALEVMNQNTVDMVFTDLEMPRMNGLEFTQAIRAWHDKKHTPVVMITSRTTSKHRELAERAGVDDYLTKPVVTQTLMETIQTWLEKTETA